MIKKSQSLDDKQFESLRKEDKRKASCSIETNEDTNEKDSIKVLTFQVNLFIYI